ncbi:MAG: type II toxin-antitoxin system Phd/YefM family antitoxin [Kiritimatiellia bacterium]|jgi:prevent-host-death family protein|nr:type II toxin-antitoxin system Phd/YefM family antitoxin [Kiritimatiellia bacterium]MDP6810175.1 type II toxin-antitoxin system Phd/YefM family antitoxin [Kiritimatiellia bacterium]MDP7022919.1 type II toxin-antitoxin system Phd/YefM family antitoxin [Kiritimatiellia bacterium]
MKTQIVGAFEAKTHFSSLLEKAHQGTVIVVTRRGKPVAQLGPTEEHFTRPSFGSAKGQIHIAPDFDEPLDDMAEYQA